MKTLADALDRARSRRSRTAKEESIAQAIAVIAATGDDRALATAARIASGRMLPVGDGRALGVGGSLLTDVVCDMTGYDAETIVACARRTGDMAEAFALLVARVEHAAERPGIALTEIAALASALASESGRTGKRALLVQAFARATPLETKYLCKALGGGMRIGAQESVVVGAIARAFGVPIGRLRAAAGLVTDVGELAVLASHGRLDDAHLVLGRPIAFMLATPLETVASPIDPAAFVVEDKIDGVRAQAHRMPDGEVALFARGLDRVTNAFPEIADALRRLEGPVVLDGEIVAVTPEGRPRPFQALQPRLKKTLPTSADVADAPVVLVAFDLLADDFGPLAAQPWHARRARLDRLAATFVAGGALRVNPTADLAADVPLATSTETAFTEARGRGHEGLVLKRKDALYEAGRRGQAWIKVKRAHATIDAVVVAAEEGHGRRAGILSDYTFAVWRDNAEGAGEELVPIGKAYSGLTDDEIDAMTKRLEDIILERRGGLRVVRPEIVLEIAFDGLQRSSRHASGFALRFPRIVRIRDDKRPDEADRLKAVEAIFAAQVASGHREQEPRGRIRRNAKKKARVAANQLSLFGDDERAIRSEK